MDCFDASADSWLSHLLLQWNIMMQMIRTRWIVINAWISSHVLPGVLLCIIRVIVSMVHLLLWYVISITLVVRNSFDVDQLCVILEVLLL